MLFTAGRPVESLHNVVSGVLALSITLPKGRRQIVDLLFPGNSCGLFHSDSGHMFDCEALTEATTCAVDARHLRKLTVGRADLAKAIDDELALALNRMSEHIVRLGKLSAAERLLHFLQWLEEAYSKRGVPIRPLSLPMTRSDIGDYLGMQLETVSRAFASLKKQDLVRLLSTEQVMLPRSSAARLEGLGALSAAEFRLGEPDSGPKL
jgi:CRP/FNR family transcriptional regulator